MGMLGLQRRLDHPAGSFPGQRIVPDKVPDSDEDPGS
jgi:hypothetical protein